MSRWYKFILYLGLVPLILLIEFGTSVPQAKTLSGALPVAQSRDLTIREQITMWSARYGVNSDLAHCIALKESGYWPDVSNAHSSAGGVYQFIDSTWISTVNRMEKDWTLADKYDGAKNVQAGIWLLAHDGDSHWEVVNLGWCDHVK